MGHIKMKSVLLGFAAAAALATTASAAVVTFDFQSPGPNADAGNSHTYTAGSPAISITATAFPTLEPTGAPNHLFDKSGGGDENGLGLTSDPSGDHEISGANFIQIDVSALPVGSVDSFQMGSTTGGEGWTVFGSNTAGVLGSALAGLTDVINDEGVSHTLPGGYEFYDFKAAGIEGSNVLLHEFVVTTAVPEPATWAMMLIGIGGLGGMLRASRKSASSAALA
jgi:hypothetical protein